MMLVPDDWKPDEVFTIYVFGSPSGRDYAIVGNSLAAAGVSVGSRRAADNLIGMMEAFAWCAGYEQVNVLDWVGV